MALIKFERTAAPAGSVQFSRNPSPGDYRRTLQYMQPKDYSNSGDLYSYNKAINPKNYRTLKWKNIPAADYAGFMTFLTAVAGSAYNFTFTDTDGATYTARITNADNIQSQPVVTGRESLTIELVLE
jgi:hypothetical protein